MHLVTSVNNQVFIDANPLTPLGDQDRISHYSINPVLSRRVLRIKREINQEIISWSNTKFSNCMADRKKNCLVDKIQMGSRQWKGW